MARTLPTGFAAVFAAGTVRPIYLAEIDWPSGLIRVWTGYGDLSWAGHTWQGTGEYGRISDVEESTEGGANGLTLELSGIPSANIIDALSNDAQGRSGKVWIGALKADGTLECDPYEVFDGFIDVTPWEDTGDTCTISVQLEKERINRRAQTRRATHEDQQIDYPGDMFFEYVAGLESKVVNWGGATTPGAAATPGAVQSKGYSSPPRDPAYYS